LSSFFVIATLSSWIMGEEASMAVLKVNVGHWLFKDSQISG